MSKKIVVLGPLPPSLGSATTHNTRYIELLKSTGWKTAAYSYTYTTRTGRFGKIQEILAMFASIYLKVHPGAWDALHVQYCGLGYLLALAPLLKTFIGRKVVVFHSTQAIQDLQNRSGLLRHLAQSLLDSFDLFVVAHEETGKGLQKLGLSRPEITTMPADLPSSARETDIEPRGTSIDQDQEPVNRFVEKVIGPSKAINMFMKSILIHMPIFLLLLALVFLSFGMLCTTPLWAPVDFQVLSDAHILVQDPGAMFHHVGFYFSQPALQLAFLAEYHFFGINPAGYIAVNLFIHTITSFLVYMLVNLLFPRKNLAILAAVLFAFGVGSYGKVFMAVHNLESLLLASLHLMVLYSFIRNDHRRGGGLRSPFFILGLVLFLLTGLTRSASFSLIGSLLAYKVFFNRSRGIRAVFSSDLLVLMGIGILYYWAQDHWGYQQEAIFSESTTIKNFTWLSLKTIFRYLTLMFFPMQNTRLMETVPFFVTWLYEARAIIRTFLALAIISYSFFGFVFGNKAVRFFIAWTLITLLPFTGITDTGSWLNLNHLYLTSLGFCVILSAGAIGTSGLLARRRWHRYIPFLFPLSFVLISLVLTAKFDERNNYRARTPNVIEMHEELVRITRN
jgi:hypothetical protein